jgi:hypothetical protein
MKKSILFFTACFFATCISLAGNNVESPKSGFSIIQNGPMIKILYKGSKASDVKVSILDSRSHKVFSEIFKRTDGFNRPYNMKDLPAGEYVVQVEDDNGVSTKNIVINEKNGKAFKVAKLFREEGKLLLTIGRYSKGFDLKIVDKTGKIVYSESKKLNDDFAQVYDIRKIKGEVTVIVNDCNGNEEKFQF